MFASIIRIALLAGLVFGGYKLYPHIKPSLQPYLSNPAVLGTQALDPVIKTVNGLLPENLRIPTNKPASDTPNSTQAKPDLASPDNQSNSTNLSNLTNTVIDEIKQKAGQAAQNQIDTVKKETSNAFCVALVETIKKQCGLNN